MLPKPSTWIVGGDGWAYDIGFGGLDHVLSTGGWLGGVLGGVVAGLLGGRLGGRGRLGLRHRLWGP